MTIGIFKTAAVHETVILLRARIGTAARALCFGDRVVHRVAAVGGQAEQNGPT